MSFIHYLFLGHFDHDGEVGRFEKRSGDTTYEPVLRSFLDMKASQAVLREMRGAEFDASTFPPDWSIWDNDGYLICEKYTKNNEMIEFVTRLVRRTGCNIYDASAHCEITLDAWLSVIREYSTPSATSIAGESGDLSRNP